MSTGAFKKPLDPRKLAFQSAELDGQISGSVLKRFSAAVVGDYKDIDCTLKFNRSYDGHALIVGQLYGEVNLECQRCLAPVKHKIDTEFEVRPVLTDAQADMHQKETDVVLLDENGLLDAMAVIEDELLLSLPIVSYHASNNCIETMEFGEEEIISVQQTASQDNPFAILAGLNRQDTEE